ncbi:MAG TPA: glycosyltransferase [Candidatus Eremiobacteraceae bacterium]|nr:glycosyltransferase [Candidatus Eremiobacteraceae bacterium]
MRRLLVVAYYYPPQPRAGSLRPSYIARNAADFGWLATVLTVAFERVSIVSEDNVYAVSQLLSTPRISAERAPQGAPRRRSRVEQFARNVARAVLYFPDDAASWYIPAVSRGVAVGRERNVDAVLSTSPPITGHFVARAIANRLRVPWIADYRDLWSGPSTPYFNHLGKIRRALGYSLERRLIRGAAAISTATDAHRQGLIDGFGRSDAVVIPNACDLDQWAAIPDVKPVEFGLCYTGAIHEGLRMPDPLFAAIAKLRAAGHPAGVRAKVHFYGNNPQIVVDAAARYGVSDAVIAHGEVDHAKAMEAQRRAAVLLLLLHTEGTPDPIEGGNVGSKIFEYIGARRPVLAFGALGSAGLRLVARLGIGRCADDISSCTECIARFHDDYLAGRYEPELSPDWQPYTPRNLASDFADLLNRTVR